MARMTSEHQKFVEGRLFGLTQLAAAGDDLDLLRTRATGAMQMLGSVVAGAQSQLPFGTPSALVRLLVPEYAEIERGLEVSVLSAAAHLVQKYEADGVQCDATVAALNALVNQRLAALTNELAAKIARDAAERRNADYAAETATANSTDVAG